MFTPSLLRSAAIVVACIAAILFLAPRFLRDVPAPGYTGPVHLQDMTWTQVHAAIEAGYRTVIIPTGGTEQNGPHAILGKHNYIISHTSERIAQALGKTLVAPVIAYVPEGDHGPDPTGHMRWPGTISLPDPVFEHLLRATVFSLTSHGFTEILLIGDSGGNQAAQAHVAEQANRLLTGQEIAVRHVSDYYDNNGGVTWLRQAGFEDAQIGSHAGLRDTSELKFVHPQGVTATPVPAPKGRDPGFTGRPDLATVRIGETLIQMKVDAARAQIKRLRARNP